MNKAQEALDNIKNTEITEWSYSGTAWPSNIFEQDDKNIAVLQSLVTKFGDIPSSIKLSDIVTRLQPLFNRKLVISKNFYCEGEYYVHTQGSKECSDDAHVIFFVTSQGKLKKINAQPNTRDYVLQDIREDIKWLYLMWLNETIIEIDEGEK